MHYELAYIECCSTYQISFFCPIVAYTLQFIILVSAHSVVNS